MAKKKFTGKKNTGKRNVVITSKPTQTTQHVHRKPNGNTVIVEKDKNVVAATTTKDVIKYDEAGLPTAEVHVTRTVNTVTTPITRTVANKDGEVIRETVDVKHHRNVTVVRTVEPYSPPDYGTQIPETPVVTETPTQDDQVRTVPDIETGGQVVPPIVVPPEVVYIPVGSVATTVNGAVMGQTFRSPRNGIITEAQFAISDVGTSGDLIVSLCGTKTTGEPDLSNVIAETTVAFADLAVGWQPVAFEPAYVKKGTLYAFVLVSSGAHTFETAVGGKFSEGSFFYSQDGAWFLGNLDEDLGMRVYYAEFAQTQMTVNMNPIDLAGGIGGVQFQLYDIMPESTDRVLQAQIAGVWTNLVTDDSGYPFAGLPAQVVFRQVISGTKDVMPLTNYDISRSIAFRSRTDFTGVSKLITTGAAVTGATVTATLSRYVEADHDCVVSLLESDGTPIAHSAVSDKATDNPLIIERTWTFSFAALSTFRIKVAGTTNSALKTFGVTEILYSCT